MEKMAELMNAAGEFLAFCQKHIHLDILLAFVAGGAQRPPKIVKLDFFLIHGLITSRSLMGLLEVP